jgi:hypothetical protein
MPVGCLTVDRSAITGSTYYRSGTFRRVSRRFGREPRRVETPCIAASTGVLSGTESSPNSLSRPVQHRRISHWVNYRELLCDQEIRVFGECGLRHFHKDLSENTESAFGRFHLIPLVVRIVSKTSDLVASDSVGQCRMTVCKSASDEPFPASTAPDSAPPLAGMSVSPVFFAWCSPPTRGALHSRSNFRYPLVDRKRRWRDRSAFFRIPVHVKTFGDSLRQSLTL